MNDNPFTSNTPLNGPIRVRLKISDTKPITCPCGGEIFRPDGILLRRVSVILTGGKADIVPMEGIVYCAKCCKPMTELLPNELKPDYIDVDATKVV